MSADPNKITDAANLTDELKDTIVEFGANDSTEHRAAMELKLGEVSTAVTELAGAYEEPHKFTKHAVDTPDRPLTWSDELI